ncbi:MAG: IS66 family insertion sequence element accessory protein TnpB [Anaeromyxobacter sp.]
MDMRKSIDGLTAIVQQEMEGGCLLGATSSSLCRGGATGVKILAWDKGGFVLVYKRLERGQFKLPHMDPSTMAVRDRRHAARDAARRDRLRPRRAPQSLEAPIPDGSSGSSSHGQARRAVIYRRQ